MPTRLLIAYGLIALFIAIGLFAAWRLSRGSRHRPMRERWLPEKRPRAVDSSMTSAMARPPAVSGPRTGKD